MNREIKFRAWNKKEKYMEPVDDLQMFSNQLSIGMLSKDYFLGKDDAELMQYTGLHDKNGKEIYEGDIIHINDEFLNEFNYLIEWNEEYLRYYLYSVDKEKLNKLGGILEAHLNSLEVEVIGNIYDNPELLGGE